MRETDSCYYWRGPRQGFCGSVDIVAGDADKIFGGRRGGIQTFGTTTRQGPTTNNLAISLLVI